MLIQQQKYTIKAVKQGECKSAFALFHGPFVSEIAVLLSTDKAAAQLPWRAFPIEKRIPRQYCCATFVPHFKHKKPY